MTNPGKRSFYENHIVRMLAPMAAALLLVVCISGLFIYPFLFSAAGYDSAAGALSRQLLTAALAAQIAALVPALALSFVREDFSISQTLALSWIAAVVGCWAAMLILRISPLGSMNGSGVLNVMFSVLIGSVLSVAPALIATGVCILRRIISNLIAKKKR
ncbi:MAG: hypothetical protein E7327_08465 [Clostridiales bacterium]|nr:hypothetical protein [Clostridiales bacterium]